MDVHVIVKADLGIERRIRASGKHHRQRFIQRIHAHRRRAIALRQQHIRAGNGIGRALARQVLKARDILAVAADDQRRADVTIRRRKIILHRALVGHFHAVGGHVIAARVQTRENAVPLGLHKLRRHAQLRRDALRHFHIKADQLVVLVVIRPRRPRTLRRHNDFALLPNARKQVVFLRIRGGQQQHKRRQDHHDLFHRTVSFQKDGRLMRAYINRILYLGGKSRNLRFLAGYGTESHRPPTAAETPLSAPASDAQRKLSARFPRQSRRPPSAPHGWIRSWQSPFHA